MSLKAESLTLDPATESYVAKGDVRLEREGVSLFADSVIYNRLSADATALGGVRLERGDDLLRGDILRINLDSEKGELINGDLLIKKSNFRLRGNRVEKTGERDYAVEGGSFTTCNGDNPSWHFEARKIKVTLDEYATGRDALFYAGSIPVLYFPYLVFPVKVERQSGLLIPKVGRSTKKGLYITQPYYWAIDPSQDATFALDLQSSRGVGTAVDYRYLRPRGGEGEVHAYGIYDSKAAKYRGEFNQKHLEIFSADTLFSSNIHLIADRSYYKDYGEAVGEYNRQYYESTVSIDHKWERYNVTGFLSYVQDLTSAENDKKSLQRLPAVTFVGAGEKVGPLFFSLFTGVTNFEREVGTTGQRLVLHPRVSYYAHPASALELSLHVGYQQRFYNAYGAESGTASSTGGNAPLVEGSGIQGVGIADAGGILALPLERVYNGSFRHVLTPALGYSVIQSNDQDRLPFFDWDDRIRSQNMVSWSVANTITRKEILENGTPAYRDLLYLRLSQGYEFAGSRRVGGGVDESSQTRPRDLLTLVDRGHHLTDLMLEARVTPMKQVSFGVDGRFNPIEGYLSTGNLSATATGEAGRRGALGYRFSRDEVNYLEGSFSYPVFKPFVLSALERYSFGGGPLESRFALEYKHQCWSLVFSYSERPGNREFMTSFTLAGVGSLGSVRLF